MPKNHTVQNGDSVESIAYANGFFWETIWNAPENADLKQRRDSPNVLEPGDVVSVMDRRPREEKAAVDARHIFRMKGVPSVLRVRLLNAGAPRKALPCSIIAKGRTISTKTDEEGWLQVFLMPDVSEGTL